MTSFHGMTLTCPRCLRQLEERAVRSVSVHACPSCGGVFLEKAQTETVFERASGAVALVKASNDSAQLSEGHQPNVEALARCPVCAEEMTLCEAEGIRIDQCAAHGTWFDAHELRRIANGEDDAPIPRSPSPTKTSSSIGEWIEAFVDALIQGPRRGPPMH